MSKIQDVCEKAIRRINALIEFYKPIDGDSALYLEYRQQVELKVRGIRYCLRKINRLDNSIITDYDRKNSLLFDFDRFTDLDEFFYKNGMFLKELLDLKDKIKKGIVAMDVNPIKRAEIKLDNIISRTNNLTLNEWMNEDVQYNIKDALSQFVDYIRSNNLDEIVDDLKDFDGIIVYCIDEEARDDKFVLFVLQKILPIMKKNISAVKIM